MAQKGELKLRNIGRAGEWIVQGRCCFDGEGVCAHFWLIGKWTSERERADFGGKM